MSSKKSSSKNAAAGLSVGLVALLVIAALAAGAFFDRLVLTRTGSVNTGSLDGVSTLTAADLDVTVGAYTYGGQTTTISARQVMESVGGVDSFLADDGNYKVPGADAVLSFARNDIMNKLVVAEGVSVTDEEALAYATDMIGISDYALIAEQLGTDEEGARKLVAEAAALNKLYEKIVDAETIGAPEPPDVPAEGEEQTPTEAYGAYIIGLLGDEWDSEAGTWARQDGPYYAALSAEEFSASAATYAQAQSAYYVAYQSYATEYSNRSVKWTEYVNGHLSDASIEIFSMVS